eukprot:gnl/TRDRNA2_/TRDRNA2_159184_c0_seq1.p1 gnl/TRDRNA2_/TRDRNA2_159184_c0~~gnl/TRDRNA2_/TRDRNA2_159184_c0_seq1.p1  ORF type:complete len:279 (+),score=30.56 gnl/TRDRNA2_/TRDRNA2_159184_c0_seq1:68-904(+)
MMMWRRSCLSGTSLTGRLLPRQAQAKRHQTYLVARHAESDQYQGGSFPARNQPAPVLTEVGNHQAERLGTFVVNRSVDRVCLSHMLRARQTIAKIAEMHQETAAQMPAEEILEDLREMDIPEWEGKEKQQVQADFPLEYAQYLEKDSELILGGRKAWHDLHSRASGVWDQIRTEEDAAKTTFILTHREMCRALVTTAAGWPCERLIDVGSDFGHCEMVEIDWPDDEDKARRWRRVYPQEGEWRVPSEPPTISAEREASNRAAEDESELVASSSNSAYA